jgi:mono/diheme cytochrome c family protein
MMPRDYGDVLTQEELDALVRYLLTLEDLAPAPAREGAPPPIVGERRTEASDDSDGKTLYAAHCQGCHGERGQGRFGTDLTGVLVSVDPVRYARATTERGVPGSTMPAWGEGSGGPLSDAELDAVAGYVVELTRQRQPARGPALIPQQPVAERIARAALAVLGAAGAGLVIFALLGRRRKVAA